MTKREMFEAIVNGNITEEVKVMAQSEIEKMDARNAKRSSQPSTKQKENEPIKAEILTHIGDGTTAKAIGEAMGISTQKASALCRQLVESGKLTATEEKVEKRKVKVYRLAQMVNRKGNKCSPFSFYSELSEYSELSDYSESLAGGRANFLEFSDYSELQNFKKKI